MRDPTSLSRLAPTKIVHVRRIIMGTSSVLLITTIERYSHTELVQIAFMCLVAHLFLLLIDFISQTVFTLLGFWRLLLGTGDVFTGCGPDARDR